MTQPIASSGLEPPRARSAVGFQWTAAQRHAAPAGPAERLLRLALQTDPTAPGLRRQLAGLLYDQSRFDEALAVLETLALAGDGPARRLRGLCLMARGDYGAAREALEAARRAGVPDLLAELAAATARTQCLEAAAALCRQALDESPDDFRALHLEARRLFATGQPDELDRLCRALLARGGRNAELYATWATARAALGDDVSDLIDYGRMLRVSQLAEADDAGLAAELLGHANLVPPHPTRATRGGQRIDDLETLAAPRVGSLLQAIRGALDGYLDQAPTAARGPLAAYAGEPVKLQAWALILSGGAFEDWHLHPSSLLSGVCYVQCGGEGVDAGLLEFGLLPIGDAPSLAGWRRQVAPQPGRLVVFPSSYAHRTTPALGYEPRISVAFDVVRA
jgi:tetratricopeptide (TPR) repeat protein